jgi:hypothetical protein
MAKWQVTLENRKDRRTSVLRWLLKLLSQKSRTIIAAKQAWGRESRWCEKWNAKRVAVTRTQQSFTVMVQWCLHWHYSTVFSYSGYGGEGVTHETSSRPHRQQRQLQNVPKVLQKCYKSVTKGLQECCRQQRQLTCLEQLLGQRSLNRN